MSEEYISQFISHCATQGMCSPQDIYQAALDKIKEIDNKINEVDLLRPIKSNMLMVIKNLGFEPPKPSRKKIPHVSEETSKSELDSITLNHAIQICKFLETHSEGTPRQLMNEFSIQTEQDHEIYVVIKWLCSTGICQRTKSNALTKGPNWKNRPTE